MTLPDFFVIGAMKAGTTSVHRYLDQHPEIYMSALKEPQFFNYAGRPPSHRGPGDAQVDRERVSDFARYRALFRAATGERAIGEASATYLCDPHAAEGIRRHVPDARLIAVLRNPVDRAYSAYWMTRRMGRETLEFEPALEAEPSRIEQHWEYAWHYRTLGLYERQLDAYQHRFAREQILVTLYDDLQRDPRRLMGEIFRFLGVEARFAPDVSLRHNPASLRRSQHVDRLLSHPTRIRSAAKRILPASLGRRLRHRADAWNRQWNQLPPPPLSRALRRRLTESFREEILLLQERIGRDLSAWLRT